MFIENDVNHTLFRSTPIQFMEKVGKINIFQEKYFFQCEGNKKQ